MKRTKLILSANTEAPISVEELFEDRDFRSSITRAKFEELAGGWGVVSVWVGGWGRLVDAASLVWGAGKLGCAC